MTESSQALPGLPAAPPDIWSEPAPPGYRRDSKGNLIRVESINDRRLDEDAVAVRIHQFATDLSHQMGRFRDHTRDDIMAFAARVVESYGGRIGGKKGNIQLMNFEGTVKVHLAQQEMLEVGPEIQAARVIIDECLDDWCKGSSVNLQALVQAAFKPDSQGNLSVSNLIKLKNVEIDDDRWRQAQMAIADALRPRSKAEYIRIYERRTPDDDWQPVKLDLAKVRAPDGPVGDGAQQVLYRRVLSAIEHAEMSGLGKGAIQRVLSAARHKRGDDLEALS